MLAANPNPRKPNSRAEVFIPFTKSLANSLRMAEVNDPFSTNPPNAFCTSAMAAREAERARKFWITELPRELSPAPRMRSAPGATRFISPVAISADKPSEIPCTDAAS